MGMGRLGWITGLGMLAAACGTTAPPPPAPEPAPAAVAEPVEGPIPVLSLVPGTEHRQRCRLKATMEPGPESGVGTVDMDFLVDATWRVVSASADGQATMQCTVHRIRGTFGIPSVGLRMDLDTDDPALRKVMAGGNPMARGVGALVADAGTTREWVLAKGSLPEPREPGIPGAPADRGLSFISAFAWLDTLPAEPLKTGRRGDRFPIDLGSGAEEGAWEVSSYDHGTGMADIAARFSRRKVPGEPAQAVGQGSLQMETGAVEITDRFDARAGVFVSRRFHMGGGGRGTGSFFGSGGSGPVSMTMDIAIDRVESFEPSPAGPK